MLRANFEVITFDEHLGDDVGDFPPLLTTFVGDQTTLRNFSIDQTPVGQGYLTIQTFGVNDFAHTIEINGTELAGHPDLIAHGGTHTFGSWTRPIGLSVLRAGNNTIRIVRASGGDNFHVFSVVVNWREETNTSRLGLFAFVRQLFKR